MISWGIKAIGKEIFTVQGEYSANMLRKAVLKEEVSSKAPAQVPARPPILCPGCPHRSVYSVLNKLKIHAAGDIGCYTLGAVAPLSVVDTTICMGASISSLHGMEKAKGKDYIVPNTFNEPVHTFDALQSESERKSNLKSTSLSVISNSICTSFKNTNFQLCPISAEKFAHLRKQFLPPNSILQENENLDFLETQAQFYQGNNFLLTASKQDDTLYGLELLGDTSAIPQILQTFECKSGTFRVPKCKSIEVNFDEKPKSTLVNLTENKKKAFAMYFPFKKNIEMPSYFGFAFD